MKEKERSQDSPPEERPKYDIRELVKEIPKDYETEELFWGSPVCLATPKSSTLTNMS